MAIYITVDTGTTNTRISIVKDGKILDTLKFAVGAKKGIEDNAILKNTLRDGIRTILSDNQLTEQEITRILLSGMITSEFGLLPLEHLTIPAGIFELHQGMKEILFLEISAIPMVFFRGVKTTCTQLETADMMRGEETELMGIFSGGSGVYILPGSHSKIVYTDDVGRITTFSTMLTGEMIAALSQNTILQDAVSLSDSQIQKEYLLNGYDYCKNYGINEALFKVRILKNLFQKTPDEVYSFFIGVVLCSEIESILSKKPKKIIIGGKKQIKAAMTVLLKAHCDSKIVTLSDKAVEASSALGMIKIYEWKEENR